jgi:Transposase IS4
MYWENADDSDVKVVTQSLSLIRYWDIKRNVHLADNSSIDGNDKLHKVRTQTEPKLHEIWLLFLQAV